MTDPAAAAKEVAAAAGAARVRPSDLLALGTGSTAEAAIRAVARRFPEPPRPMCVASSEASERLARSLGFGVRPLRGDDRFDRMLDGADEVAPDLALTKGGGGALFREKLLARHAAELVILVDPSKLVPRLGTRHAIPVEVVPFARPSAAHRLTEAGWTVALRVGPGGGPYRTDNGLEILDLTRPGGVADPAAAERALREVPGVVESGLFVGLASLVLVGHPGGKVDELRPPGAPRGPG